MSNLAADKVLRVNCPGWGISSTLPLGEAKPLAMYDVIVINPTSILHLFEPKSDAAKDIEKLIAEGSTLLKLDSNSTVESISAELELREHELRQFLSKGGLLVYFLAPPFTVSGSSVRMDNYLWLYENVPDKLDDTTRTMNANKGKELSMLARGKQHAFAPYLKQLGMEWSTVIRKENLTDGYKSLANDSSGKCVSAYKSTGPKRGQVIFLPAPYDTRYDDVLKDCLMKWYELHTGPDADKAEPDLADDAESEPEVEGRTLLDNLFDDDDDEEYDTSKKTEPYKAPAHSAPPSDFDSLDALFAPSSKPGASGKNNGHSDDPIDKPKQESAKKSSGDLVEEPTSRFSEEPPSGVTKKKSNTLDWPELDDDVPPFAKEREKEREKEIERQRVRDEAQRAEKAKAREGSPSEKSMTPEPGKDFAAALAEELNSEVKLQIVDDEEDPLDMLMGGRDDDDDEDDEEDDDSPKARAKDLEAEKARKEEEEEEQEREREREKARKEEEEQERERAREKARKDEEEQEREREREKARKEEQDREKARQEEQDREREKARQEEQEREREKARQEEQDREREKARQEEQEREREKARQEEQDREREKARQEEQEREKARQEEQDREREKARQEEQDRERERARREEQDREYERAREEEKEREREKVRQEERERERQKAQEEEDRQRAQERLEEADRAREREKQERDREKSQQEDREREKAREMQRELDRAREADRERQRLREEERDKELARDNGSLSGSTSTNPEAKELMSRMEQEISSPGVPEWCQKSSFAELKQLHFELGDLNEQVRKARQKIGDIEDRIRNLNEVKDALLSLSGIRLTQACCKVFEALGWSVKISETSSGEVWLSEGDKTQAIVRIVYSAAQPNRSELAELAESVITYWGKYDIEPKGILVASTFAEKPPKERTEEDFPGSMGEFAKRKNLCLITSQQLLTLYRDVSIKNAESRKIRENLLTTSGILPGFRLDMSEASAPAEAAAK